MSVVIITGASRGIGASIAIQAAKRGLGVILTCNSHAACTDEVVRKIETEGGEAVALGLDVGRVIANLLSADSARVDAQNIEGACGYNI